MSSDWQKNDTVKRLRALVEEMHNSSEQDVMDLGSTLKRGIELWGQTYFSERVDSTYVQNALSEAKRQRRSVKVVRSDGTEVFGIPSTAILGVWHVDTPKGNVLVSIEEVNAIELV